MKFDKVIITLTNGQEVVVRTDSDSCADLVAMLNDIFTNAAVSVYKKLHIINDDNELDLEHCDLVESSTQRYIKLDDVKDYYAVEDKEA